METRRDIFQALADPTRRAIIALIALKAMTPGMIAEHFDSSRQAISKHIRVLSECELVTELQEGREINYRLNTKKLKAASDYLDQFRHLWEGRFSRMEKILKHKK